MAPLEREVRLKPEFADSYPMIPARRWLSAADVGARLLQYVAHGGTIPEGEDRLLRSDHFEFRGGVPRGVATLRTRHEDPEPTQARH